MPQMQLPIFPVGVTNINPNLAFSKQDGRVTYFNGLMPVFFHDQNDVRTFRMITAQFCVNGNTRQAEIARAFGVPLISVKRAVKLYRDKGPAGFYATPRRRGPAVLVPEVLAQAQQLLDQGLSVSQVAARLGLKADTLSKAVRAGRLHKATPLEQTRPENHPQEASSKSQRSAEDAAAPMGMGATNTSDRVWAGLGLLDEMAVDFKPSLDVPNAGVLLALPALLVGGLLRHTEKYFELPRGYYGLKSIFLLLAFMALARLRSVERLRYCAPGEWGKILGLDRVPEVRTLRAKIEHLSDAEHPTQWSAQLCNDWMAASPQSAATCYVDGHVRVYFGEQTKLPRHYVAREKLCMRATTDYWVNAMDGQPFLVITKEVDPGLLQVLENDIIPRLENDIPNQPTKEELAGDPLRHRFTVIFDREGYSPDFMGRMKDRHIACLTYHKYPGESWPQEEFTAQQVRLANGNLVEMKLAERGVLLGKKVWVREVRKLTDSGHQTSILSTDYRSDLSCVAAAMFARWSQENFFKIHA
ncbi:MAG: hypothetical protein KAV82_04215 [Phycisphaerae bacterium]|nr:hypothetical protein [Phycisphaerae bacterium]